MMYYAFSSGRQDPTTSVESFRLTGVRGFVELGAVARAGAVKAVRRGPVDLTVTPLELTGTERITDIEVVLTTETGDLTGVVIDTLGRPVPGMDVIVCPEDLRRCSPFSVARRPTRTASAARPAAARPGAGGATAQPATAPDGPGHFAVTRLLPGRYLVAAGRPSGFLQRDVDRLAALRTTGTLVTITAGQTTTVEITIEK
jgi:hypothetical protein